MFEREARHHRRDAVGDGRERGEDISGEIARHEQREPPLRPPEPRAGAIDCRCVTSEPIRISTPPIICSTVHGSCSTITASTMVITTWSWTTGCGQIDARDLVGPEVAIASDDEMQHAEPRHPGDRRLGKFRQPGELAQDQREREKADDAERHADGHGLERRAFDDAAPDRGIVQCE